MNDSTTPEFIPVAIIGMGCRFPKAPNVGEYWRMMLAGVDGISEVPPDRWDVDAFYDPRPATPCKVVTRNGGFVDDVDRFDPYFFGISPREATRLDPQQRMLLETTWEAMEHAGLPRERFMGSRTGVFIGVCTDDYITLERGDLKNIDIYLGTGGSRGSTAGRVAFAFGLRGPVAAIDTACSSSLVAIHQACNSLQLGDCEMALAGGANVVLHPGTAVAFSQANLLSPDGRCKAFDARANGFVRSEGAGVVLLKPLARAVADGDPIYAVIRSTASNNDGSTSPFMTPSRTGQAELLRRAYGRGGIEPGSIQYVEAHGTGTEVGDPIEVGALNDVLGEGRGAENTCLMGSSKTNLGHLEAAAGVAGVIKTVLALHNKVVPPNLHFLTPNPNIPWAELPFRVPTEVTSWPPHAGPARAGVNSFGISGTNAHIILEEAPSGRTESAHPQPARDDRAESLVLSAHTAESLVATAAAFRDLVNDGAQRVYGETLRDLCYSAAVRRTHHEHRLAVVSSSRDELARALDAFVAGEMLPGVVTGTATAGGDRRPVFVFSGIGTQWAGMGRELLESEPVFGDSMQRCDAVLRDITGWSVLEEIARPAEESRLGRIDIMQPSIFSVQVSLAALWRSWGIEPAAIVGHSLGEIAAAYIAGALSLEHAALAVCERSRLMHRTTGRGRMAAVGLSVDELTKRLSPVRDRISIAVVNSPTSCAISGDGDAIEAFAGELEREGVFCRLLNVDVACHSHQMEPLQQELAERLAHITPGRAAIPLYSTVLAQRVTGEELGALYWARNMRDRVQFSAAAELMLRDGNRAFLEISPNPALLTPLRQSAQHAGADIVLAPSLRAGPGERATLLENAAQLFANGISFDWSALYPDGRFVPPPPYVWQRERFWFEETRGSMKWLEDSVPSGMRATKHPLLKRRWAAANEPDTHYFEAELDLRTMSWLRDHRVEGMPLFPAAGYVELATAASTELLGPGQRVVRDVKLKKALFLSADQPTTVQTVVSPELRHARRVATNMNAESETSLHFHCYARASAAQQSGEQGRDGWTLLASGVVDAVGTDSLQQLPRFSPDEAVREFRSARTGEEWYGSILTGIDFGADWRSLRQVWSKHRHAVTSIQLSPAILADAKSYGMHPGLLDACFHSLIACAGENPQLSLPYEIEKVELFAVPDPSQSMWCEVRTEPTEAGYRGQIALYDSAGSCLMRVTNYDTRVLRTRAASSASASDAASWLYETRWRESVRPAAAEARSGQWLIVGSCETSARALAAALESSGLSCHVACDAEGRLGRAEFTALLAGGNDRGAYEAVVYLPGADASGRGAHGIESLDVTAERVTVSLLHLLQACADVPAASAPRLFVVSRNAKDVGEASAQLNLAQAPLAGLARVAAIELRTLRVTQVDIDSETSSDSLAAELLATGNEHEVALRGDARHVLRLARLDPADRIVTRTVRIADDSPHSWRLESPGTGVFDDLTLRLLPRQAPGRGEVEIRVAAVGLNFLDVLKGLNMAPGLPEGAMYFGMECAGRVVAVGEDVHDLAVGDEVVAMDSTASGTFRAFLTTNASAVFRKPVALSLADAATVPIAYQTAYYALRELGKLQPGESVLIHSAAGGVGLAAVRIAQQCGAVVYATAGTAEKREYLEGLGVQQVMNSRTLDFAREIMAYTNGRGVDMVLNSLAGDAIPRSLEVLATGGRFLEIGKRDIYADSQLGLLPFQRNLSFFAVDLLRMRMEKPGVVERLTREIARFMADGTFQPLPSTTFTVHEIADAFRYMAKGSHIGKIVVTLGDGDVDVNVEDVPQPVRVRADASYLVTGGLGALGIVFARHLVDQGARHLVLMGRSNPSEAATAAIGELRAKGATVSVIAADVSDRAELARALAAIRSSGVPIKGVLHAAGVTDDRTVRQLSAAQFAAVFASKVHGGWNLHELLEQDPLDFFVLFSSAASVLGGAGQANYAAANSFLDLLAHYRRRAGLPALSVNWGPWADVGMAALDDNRGARLAERGVESIPVREGTELLDMLLQQRAAQIAVMPIAWTRWAESFPETLDIPFLSDLSAELASGAPKSASKNSVRQSVLACESSRDAVELLSEHLRRDAVRILRVPEERLNVKTSLVRFGLDSLMAVELANRIEGDFGVHVPAARLLQGPSVNELAEWLYAELETDRNLDAESNEAGQVSVLTGEATVDVASLSDSEVNAMLEALLAEGGTGR